MPLAFIDPVDIAFGILFPPIGALVVYGGAYSIARTVSGGRPLSPLAKEIYRYLAIFSLGMGYLIAIFGTLNLLGWGLWASVIVCGALLAWFAWWWHRKKRKSEEFRE